MSFHNSDLFQLKSAHRMSGQDTEVNEATNMENVEHHATGLLKSLYGHQISVEGALQMLQRFQASENLWEKAVFNFTIKILFEEYKYFHAYPYVERQLAGKLMGGIVNQNLLNKKLLSIAIKLIFEALCNPPENPMFDFGVAATVMFKDRLKEFPGFCRQLEEGFHFKRNAPKHLIRWVRAGALSVTPEKMSNSFATSVFKPPGLGKQFQGPPGFGPPDLSDTNQGPPGFDIKRSSSTKSNLGKRTPEMSPLSDGLGLLWPTGRVLDEAKEEKVFFLFNNLTLENLSLKTQELSEALNIEEHDHGKWLSQYLVRRATIEPNLHSLYVALLLQINSSSFESMVVDVTYKNIGIMLEAKDKSAGNRSVLRNLGLWLGLLLLARDKPILNLDLRHLIIEAFHSGEEEMHYVLPFVTSTLRSASKSKVFKLPCPWTTGLVDLLVEVHQQPNLKLNLKFEIEVLCNSLGFDVTEPRSGGLKTQRGFQDIENPVIQTTAGFPDAVHLQPCYERRKEHQEHHEEHTDRVLPSNLNNQNCQSLTDFISLWSLGNQPTAQANHP